MLLGAAPEVFYELSNTITISYKAQGSEVETTDYLLFNVSKVYVPE